MQKYINFDLSTKEVIYRGS